ncbi:unnamed protein product [Prorocentrum cordatum]|uniref:Uncharacterized protein n=1 Tax=Prorocentrum cordatum TaxID=2364126 RepID=A0ABN9PQY3_9DINO|nr:unnamed protein product [Polarella glacialis]
MPPQPPPARDAPVRFVQVNPRRRGSKAHARYERYKHGASIAEALRLGALPGDIAWDLQRGFVRAAAGGGATGMDIIKGKSNGKDTGYWVEGVYYPSGNDTPRVVLLRLGVKRFGSEEALARALAERGGGCAAPSV